MVERVLALHQRVSVVCGGDGAIKPRDLFVEWCSPYRAKIFDPTTNEHLGTVRAEGPDVQTRAGFWIDFEGVAAACNVASDAPSRLVVRP